MGQQKGRVSSTSSIYPAAFIPEQGFAHFVHMSAKREDVFHLLLSKFCAHGSRIRCWNCTNFNVSTFIIVSFGKSQTCVIQIIQRGGVSNKVALLVQEHVNATNEKPDNKHEIRLLLKRAFYTQFRLTLKTAPCSNFPSA